MGRWLPNHRKGTPEQTREYDKAQRELDENTDREYRDWRARGGRPGWMPGGGMPESDRYLDLNDRVARAAEPLSRVQQAPLAGDVREAKSWWRENRARYKAQRAQQPKRGRAR